MLNNVIFYIRNFVFPGVNQNTIVNLMPEYLCGVLMKGSETLSLETNKDILIWGAVLLFIPYLWISIIHLWISIIHLWISLIHFRISLNNYGYP